MAADRGVPGVPGLGSVVCTDDNGRDVARWRRANEYADVRLDTPSAEERVQALEDLDAAGDGLAALAGALEQEPDPAVRVAILEKLDQSGSVIALQSVLPSLADPDPEVAVAAAG